MFAGRRETAPGLTLEGVKAANGSEVLGREGMQGSEGRAGRVLAPDGMSRRLSDEVASPGGFDRDIAPDRMSGELPIEVASPDEGRGFAPDGLS